MVSRAECKVSFITYFLGQAMFYPSKIALFRFDLAEGVGFEPTDTFVSPVFKTGAFGHSATPPQFIVII